MRALVLPIMLATLFGVPQTVSAGSSFSDRDEAYWARQALKTLCMGHRLDREGTLRQAEADGWAPLPAGEVPPIPDLRLADVSARWKASPRGGRVVLLVGDGGEAGPGCAIAYQGPFKTASSVIGGHFMLPVRRFETIGPTYHLWAFVEEPGKRRKAVKSYFGKIDLARIASSRAAQTFSTIAVIGNPATGGAAFLYSVPPPVPAGGSPEG